MQRKDSLLIEFTAEAIDFLNNTETVLLKLEKAHEEHQHLHDEDINFIFRCFHTIKGTSGFLHLPNIVRITHEAESLLDVFRTNMHVLPFDFAGDLFLVCDELKKGFRQIESDLNDKSLEKSAEQIAEILHNKLEKINEYLSEIKSDKPDNENKEKFGFFDAGETIQKNKTVENSNDTVLPGEVAVNTLDVFQSKEIKISTEKLDQLLDLVGELVIAEEAVNSHPELKNVKLDLFYDTARHLHKIVKEIQELMLLTRVLPLSTVFQRLNRVARDFQKSSGKKINFIISGEEHEVDKSILEWVADPLVHLLRNAIDHGLETPEERVNSGKPETGQIRLQAVQTGTEIWITITDDGRGLDKEKILQKAVEHGILESISNNLSESEIYDLIFVPGLSTSKAVTEISGRGVGMDIVKQNLNRLNGRIDVSSTPGAGTRFHMKIPLLAGIMEGTVFCVGQMYFALQTVEIQELVKLDDSLTIHLTDGLRMVYIRNQHIPVFNIADIIDLPAGIMGSSKPDLLIVIEYEGEKIALKADSILGNHSLIIKPMGSILSGARGISGFSILANGNVSIILDVKSIYEFFIKKAREAEQTQNTTIGKILEEKGALVS